jgi:Domain of unknown function (DUF4380)
MSGYCLIKTPNTRSGIHQAWPLIGVCQALGLVFAICSGVLSYDGAVNAATSNPLVVSSTVPSKLSDSDYRFTLPACKIEMSVNPQMGARVSRLSYDNIEVIKPHQCGGSAYSGTDACNSAGSTFWTSPQKAWPIRSWPPVESIDGAPYAATITGSHLVLNGKADPTSGVHVDKDFSVDAQHCKANLRYVINADKPIAAAPWEITRVPRGGIVFFLQGDSAKLAGGPLTPYLTTTASPTSSTMVWFDDSAQRVPNSRDGSKLIADGANGWLAYVRGNVLFVKQFADMQSSASAPNEGEIEIYPGSDFLELEVQGPYTTLTSGGKLSWDVQWRVAKLPSTVVVAVGSTTLLEFVARLVVQ